MRLLKLISFLVLISLPGFSQEKTIKIGLLVNDMNSIAAINAANMAITKANEEGGYKGNLFKLEIRSLEGPWGTGSKQAVSLIFDEKVCAIMGSHDGRNAHLVEQASTKAKTVFLSAWSGDPTLSQAFVPWFFTCVPSDIQQADALIREIYGKRKIKNIAVVTESGYDTESALNNFLKQNKAAGKNQPVQFRYKYHESNLASLADSIDKAKAEGVILFGNPASSLEIVKLLRLKKTEKTIFGTLLLLAGNQNLKSFENVALTSGVHWSSNKASAFNEEYKKLYGTEPGSVAAYSYDGMTMLTDAIRNTGTERENIQKYLAGVIFDGVTGRIQLDEKGKRIGIPGIMQTK
jgi:branched-chain amino acid transport system substrate-binding protein